MRGCRFEDLIDSYLLNKLSQEETERFEEHYFNCARCFSKLQEREEILKVIKAQGPALIENLEEKQRRLISWAEEAWLFMNNRRWLAAPALAALLIIAVLIFSPLIKEQPPTFVLNGENIVRGQAINLISPIIDVDETPLYFEWKKQGENLQYKVYLYDSNNNIIWSATTTETRIILPEEIRQQMKRGEKYSWQVKALSSVGTLVAVSSRLQFMIKSN